MKTIIYIIIIILMCLYAGDIYVSFSPFKIVMRSPLKAAGLALLVIGLFCLSLQSYRQGKGDMLEELIELANKEETNDTEI